MKSENKDWKLCWCLFLKEAGSHARLRDNVVVLMLVGGVNPQQQLKRDLV